MIELGSPRFSVLQVTQWWGREVNTLYYYSLHLTLSPDVKYRYLLQ